MLFLAPFQAIFRKVMENGCKNGYKMTKIKSQKVWRKNLLRFGLHETNSGGRGGEGGEGQRVKQHLHIISKTQHLKLNSWKVKQWGLVEKWGCLCLYQVEFSDFWKKFLKLPIRGSFLLNLLIEACNFVWKGAPRSISKRWKILLKSKFNSKAFYLISLKTISLLSRPLTYRTSHQSCFLK